MKLVHMKMNCYDKYHFRDFTLENYRRLLCIAISNGYTFSDYVLPEVPCHRTIVWRHDVEFSVHRALKMAKIEQELSIKAHYFVQIHSDFYNTFEREIYELFLQIRDLGHYIGLHFDAQFWKIDNLQTLEIALQRDKHILEELLEIQISSFSFHNTTPDLLAFNELYYASMMNVYAKDIMGKYQYCTDSTGIWRYERLEDILRDETITHLQVLTHDGMWQDEPMAPRQRVLRCIEGRAQKTTKIYDECLEGFGHKNIDKYFYAPFRKR
jgi:hypothetical protein